MPVRTIVACVCLGAFCLAQTPAGPDISAYYRLKSTDLPVYRWLRVDPPLTLTVDSAGMAHLGINLPPGPCVTDAHLNTTCQGLAAPVHPDPVYAAVSNETPVRITGLDVPAWGLAHVSTNTQPVVCTRNGMPQTEGVDFTPNGDKLVSGSWQDSDALSCSYSYQK